MNLSIMCTSVHKSHHMKQNAYIVLQFRAYSIRGSLYFLVADGANKLCMEITEIQSPLMRLGGSGVYCALVDSPVILLSIGGICAPSR